MAVHQEPMRAHSANNMAGLSTTRMDNINLNGGFVMSKDDDNKKYYEDHMKHWRSWGSWFSWGSPVGLGLFFIAVCFSIWLLGLTFNWG